jgi:hypothetical protein
MTSCIAAKVRHVARFWPLEFFEVLNMVAIVQASSNIKITKWYVAARLFRALLGHFEKKEEGARGRRRKTG